jgi:hypothetical protein
MVYLTSCYAAYFAMCAVEDGDTRGAVVEIDTDQIDHSLLRPDEDFVYLALHRTPDVLKRLRLHKLSPKGRRAWIRRNINRYRTWWEASIANLGNVAYAGPIHPFAITRIASFDVKDPMVMANALEPTISLANFKFCSSQYKALTAYVMGDEVKPEDFDTFGQRLQPNEREHMQRRYQAIEEAISKRDVKHLQAA